MDVYDIDDDTLQIVHSIDKLKKYIEIIKIGDDIEQYQVYIKNYPIKQELQAVEHSLHTLNATINDLNIKDKNIQIELAGIQRQLTSIYQKQSQFTQNTDKLLTLMKETESLMEKLSLYKECNKIFNMLPHEILSNKVDQFIYNINAILDTFKYQINASLKPHAIDINIVALFQDKKRGQIIDYPSGSEQTLINTVISVVLNQLSHTEKFLMIDDLFSTLDDVSDDLFDLIKSAFNVTLLTIPKNKGKEERQISIAYDYDTNSSTISV